jgi:PAS domain S-box-containing protein
VENDTVLELFFDSITDQAVFNVDAGGIIRTWSEACRRMKFFTAEEAIGNHFRMLYLPEDRERGAPEAHLQTALDDGVFHEERFRLRKGDVPFMAEVSVYPIEENGGFAGFAKIVKDVSARHQLTVQRDALERTLISLNNELTGFCHSVAHDLKSPIRAIISKSRIMQETYADSLPQAANDDFDAIVAHGRRLADFVDDLLDYANLGQADVRRENIDVTAMARRLAAEIAPTFHGGDVHIESEDGLRARADPTMLEFVLRNLFENSCKYSLPGVHVHFGMTAANDGEEVFRVQDDGIGFEMEQAARLFEPFHRLHGQRAYVGSGIGLANVKRIVERHGGRVWAESEPGKGSTFYFTLSSDSLQERLLKAARMIE